MANAHELIGIVLQYLLAAVCFYVAYSNYSTLREVFEDRNNEYMPGWFVWIGLMFILTCAAVMSFGFGIYLLVN